MYCTYITIYIGNKLPPFYIGYSTISKINRGYHGTVTSKKHKKVWIEEMKRNPSFFKTKIIKIFDTRESAINHESYLHKHFNVDVNPMYINEAISNIRWRNSGGYKLSEETKQKQRNSFTVERLSKMSSEASIRWSNKSEEEKENCRKRFMKYRVNPKSREENDRYKVSRTNDEKNSISIGTKEAMNNQELRERLSEKAKARCTDEWKAASADRNKHRVSCVLCRKEMARCGFPMHFARKHKI